MFSSILVYCQLGQFLTLVMTTSWLFATFFFLSLCYFVGPVGHFGQINSCGGSEVIEHTVNFKELLNSKRVRIGDQTRSKDITLFEM